MIRERKQQLLRRSNRDDLDEKVGIAEDCRAIGFTRPAQNSNMQIKTGGDGKLLIRDRSSSILLNRLFELKDKKFKRWVGDENRCE